MSSAVKETQSTSSAVWDSPHPFKTATQTHFVEVIGSGLSSADVGQEDESTLWRGSIAEEFLTGLAPFGGYVVAIFVNAARNEVARRGLASRYPDPVSLSTTFLAPGRAGPIDIIISTLRQGGRFLVLEYVVKQKQAAQVVKLLAGSITFSNMSNEEGETDLSAVPFPDLPPKEQCSSSGWARHANQRGMWGLMTTLEPPYGEKELERKQLTRGWTKWCRWQRDGDDARTPESLSFFSDLYGMPAMSRMGSWFPTMDLQIQLRSLPKPTDGPWLRIRSVSKYTINGRKEFDTEIWNEDGTRLLALARQMTIIIDAAKRMEKNKAKL